MVNLLRRFWKTDHAAVVLLRGVLIMAALLTITGLITDLMGHWLVVHHRDWPLVQGLLVQIQEQPSDPLNTMMYIVVGMKGLFALMVLGGLSTLMVGLILALLLQLGGRRMVD